MGERPIKNRIMVVDDQRAILEFMQDLLTLEGYSVELKSNGREALESLKVSATDLVITDFTMPLMNGWELVQAIRASSHMESLPIIVISAASKLPFSSSDLDAYTAVLGKPFHIAELLELTQQMLR